MAGKELTADRDNVVAAYLSGETAQSLGRRYGLAPQHVRTYLERWDIPIRGRSEANALRLSLQPEEETMRRIRAAQDRRRGQKDSLAVRERRALTRQTRQLFVGAGEALLMDWLRERGMTPIPQQAIGPYNIDVGILPVAVELLIRAAMPHNRPRERRKIEYLLDRGFSILFIWISKRDFLSPAAAEEAVRFYEFCHGDPSPPREYRVIRGSGQLIARACSNLDNLTFVPAP